MARRKSGLFRLIVKKVRANQKAKRQAAIKQAKANVRNTELIRKQHRTTAGEIKATGEFHWEGAGLPDSTVMEPVMGKNGWEWHPVKTRPTKRAPVEDAWVDDMIPDNVLHDESWFEPAGEHNQNPSVQAGAKVDPSKITTMGVLRKKYGKDLAPGLSDSQEVITAPMPDGNSFSIHTVNRAPNPQRCGAPTKDGHGCRNVGNCPIPAHKKHRRGK